MYTGAIAVLDLRLRALRFCIKIDRSAAVWSSAAVVLFGLSGVCHRKCKVKLFSWFGRRFQNRPLGCLRSSEEDELLEATESMLLMRVEDDLFATLEASRSTKTFTGLYVDCYSGDGKVAASCTPGDNFVLLLVTATGTVLRNLDIAEGEG
jgi:hypothetical protein